MPGPDFNFLGKNGLGNRTEKKVGAPFFKKVAGLLKKLWGIGFETFGAAFLKVWRHGFETFGDPFYGLPDASQGHTPFPTDSKFSRCRATARTDNPRAPGGMNNNPWV